MFTNEEDWAPEKRFTILATGTYPSAEKGKLSERGKSPQCVFSAPSSSMLEGIAHRVGFHAASASTQLLTWAANRDAVLSHGRAG